MFALSHGYRRGPGVAALAAWHLPSSRSRSAWAGDAALAAAGGALLLARAAWAGTSRTSPATGDGGSRRRSST
jgi:hypothetical protein